MSKVKVFSIEDCAGCITVKTILTQQGIPFEELDGFGDEAMKYRVRTLPTTVVDEHVVAGSSVAAIDLIKKLVKDL